MVQHVHALRLRRALVLAAVAGALALPLPVAAREVVDPASLTPPINPAANPTCGWAGSQVICSSELRFTVTDAPTGIVCYGGELLESSERHTSTLRFYDADLLLVKHQFQERIDGILYVAETGELVRWTGTDTGIQRLAVPGDPGTGTLVNSGAIIHLHLADGRSISIAGRTIEDLETGDVVLRGHNPGVHICDLIA